jgi:hypothetical protein
MGVREDLLDTAVQVFGLRCRLVRDAHITCSVVLRIKLASVSSSL